MRYGKWMGCSRPVYGWVVDLDFENYFDSIPKGPLLGASRRAGQ